MRNKTGFHHLQHLSAFGAAAWQIATYWVVDDDRSIRWVLERALEQAGMTTMSFDNGDAMLQRLTREQPDVIISDIRMPGIDGIALLERVHHDLPKVPVIIMTAHSDLESAVSSYQSGAFDYLPKPFDVDDAMAMVRRAVTHAHEQTFRARSPKRSDPRKSSARRRRCRKYFAPSDGCLTRTSPC